MPDSPHFLYFHSLRKGRKSQLPTILSDHASFALFGPFLVFLIQGLQVKWGVSWIPPNWIWHLPSDCSSTFKDLTIEYCLMVLAVLVAKVHPLAGLPFLVELPLAS